MNEPMMTLRAQHGAEPRRQLAVPAFDRAADLERRPALKASTAVVRPAPLARAGFATGPGQAAPAGS